MIRVVTFVLTGLLSFAVGQSEDPQRVRLEPLNISLLLPQDVNITLMDKAVYINLNPGGRQIRRCRLEILTAVPEIDAPQRVHLTDELILSYRIETFSGGSGGEEQTLTGILRTPDAVYSVESHDQAEFPSKPDPRFCLEYLSSLEHSGLN